MDKIVIEPLVSCRRRGNHWVVFYIDSVLARCGRWIFEDKKQGIAPNGDLVVEYFTPIAAMFSESHEAIGFYLKRKSDRFVNG